MKKNIITIVVIIVASLAFTLGIIYFKDISNWVNDEMSNYKERLEVKKAEKQGMLVLVDGSKWYKISEDEKTYTLISAYTLNSDGTFNEDGKNIFKMKFDSSEACAKDATKCSIMYDGNSASNIASFVNDKYFDNLLQNLKDHGASFDGLTIRFLTTNDLEALGCDIVNNSCVKAKDGIINVTYWTTYSYVDNKNEIFVISEDGLLKSTKVYEEAAIRPVLTVAKENIK